jgi:glycosyltransferase involved in cell wall biosynthesis
MKVLMFGWEFPPHISGGLGTACFGITTGLLKHDVEVLFVVPRLYGNEDHQNYRLINANEVLTKITEKQARKSWEKLNYIQINSDIKPYVSPEEYAVTNEKLIEKEDLKEDEVIEILRSEFKGDYGKDLMKEVARYAIVASHISKNNSHDLIHAHDWLTFPAGIAAKEVSGKPLIAHVHATEFDRSGENINEAVFGIEKKGMEAADHIIAVSAFTRNIIINKYGISPEKVSVVYNAVMPKDCTGNKIPAKRKGEQLVTFMGRITYQKGPEYFVEAARKLIKKHPKIRFIMAGSGDMLNAIIAKVAELKLSSRFYFTGFMKGEEVDKIYAMTDVYVMPSVSEPFGIAPLEAMRSNVPVVISKQSGVSEVVKHAIKVDFWDTDALADAISALLKHKPLSKTFSEKGKDEVDLIKWENTGADIKNIYTEQLVASAKSEI